MDINEIRILVLYICAKNQQGYISPSKFNTVMNQGQRSYAAYLLGSFAQYTPGRPIARVELGQNSVIRQRLSPIIYGYNLTVNSDGYSRYPGDFLQVDAMWSIYGYQRIRYADQNKFSSIYNSVITPISTNPIYVLEYENFRFFPNNTANAKLNYVKNPPDMIWGYVDDANGRPVYSAAHSTQPIWDDVAIFEVIVRALALVGVNLQAPAIAQYAAQIKREGQ